MKRLACLAILRALALPCAAARPKVDRTIKRDRPSIDPRQNVMMAPKLAPLLLNDETVRAALFPFAAYAEQVADRVKWYRRMLENGGQGRGHGPYWPLLD